MPKIATISLGCEKNLVDTEVMLGVLNTAGYQITTKIEKADIILINTCGFVESAKQESINAILEMAQYKEKGICRLLVVSGCLSQKYKDELMAEIPEIDIIIGTGEIKDIADIIKEAVPGERIKRVGEPSFLYDYDLPRITTTPKYTVYLKIAEGCDNYCSYCTIPEVRGRYRSRPLENIVSETKKFVDAGSKEIILIAQDTTYYGVDLYKKLMLPKLLGELNNIDGYQWLRMLYCYPNYFSQELINSFKNCQKLCKYVDLPLQHIDNTILNNMNRNITDIQIKNLIESLRNNINDLTIRTTFIVGFPGETDQQFKYLLNFIKETEFDRMGIFTFSQEPGTPASQMPNQVPDEVKLERYNLAMELQQKISMQKNKRKIGQIVPTLIEGTSQLDNELYYCGRSQSDAPDVDGKVFFKSNADLEPGNFINIRINQALEYDLIGEVVDEFSQ